MLLGRGIDGSCQGIGGQYQLDVRCWSERRVNGVLGTGRRRQTMFERKNGAV